MPNPLTPQSVKSLSHEAVNHPPHYTQGAVECIDALEAALGPDGFRAYCRGAALKYLWRTDLKNGQEDLQKARWYINRLLADED
jgi:hypothetical protein